MQNKSSDVLKKIADIVGFEKDSTATKYTFTKHEFLLILNYLDKGNKKIIKSVYDNNSILKFDESKCDYDDFC